MKGASLLLCLFIGQTFGNTININQAVDELLASGKQILKAKGQNTIKLKEINKTFQKKIWGVPVQGTFTATDGNFEDLSTLHRTGDVTMNTQGNTLTLTASLGLDTLKVSYSHYDFKLLAIQSSGSMAAQCLDNSISAKIRLVYTGPSTCKVFVDSASIDRLGKFTVNMTGPGSLNQLGDLLINWILNNFNSNIRGIVNQRLQSALQDAVSKVNICNKIPAPS